MTFEEFIRWMATPAALGIVSSFVLQVLRKHWPVLDEGWAWLASTGFALVGSVVAMRLIAILPTLPPEVAAYWPLVVWFWEQLTFWLLKDRVALYTAKKEG